MKRKKQTVAVVGSGNLGRVLAMALDRAGYRVVEIINRDLTRARKLAGGVSARAVALDEKTPLVADVFWICVTDDAIPEVAAALAHSKTEWRGKVVVHTSGAYGSAELKALKRKGAAVASAHPMNSFVRSSKPDFRGVPFALEGDGVAVKLAGAIATSLGGEVFTIRPEDKVLYHAMGAFSSPLLVSLLYAGERLGKAAGLREPRKVMARILRETVENFLQNGGEAAFSGPIKRGDLKTVEKHLKALSRVQGTQAIYQVLAIQAVHGLPGKEKKAMLKALSKTLAK
ncbi:MAG TPA: DUF2520 domain-containing protein [Terriglobales bacterium]|nr:DUF2520 domain-containing protein [Terriglobales bacterium]